MRFRKSLADRISHRACGLSRFAAVALLLAGWFGPLHWVPKAAAEPHTYAVPYVPNAANSARQGFVRIKNHSNEAGDVRITPIDDTGRRFPVLRIHLEALAAVHFNSLDLEHGNVSKGLSRGVGAGTGDWRLEIEADFLFEALAYVRTRDGFVTSVYEAANWWDAGIYWVPFFNPGANTAQVSKLRLVNPTGETATINILGLDDAGNRAPGGRVELALPPRASRMFTAQELENGAQGFAGRLGDGSGKWRLWVSSDRRLHVLSLLESPTGNITNLSTGAWWTRTDLPLVLSDSDPDRQGFVRIINHSARDGEVAISAVDDTGETRGPVTLTLKALAARHFNSSDLANGNPDKGLSHGIGTFSGDVRLELDTDLIVTPLAYVRTSDGFVTSVHDTALHADGLTMASFLNPGSNSNQESLLRIVNPTDTNNSITIYGRDDRGQPAPGGSVRLSLPPHGTRTLSALELERGGDGFSGRLGDGIGKWALLIDSDESIRAMSLLNSPTGNLTNLSATPYTQRLRITNAPVAHDISLSTDLSSPNIEVQLTATDPDNDALGFALAGDRTGPGYRNAHVEWSTGKLLATLDSEAGQTVNIPFRATDGSEWSDQAFVRISINEDSGGGDRGLGAEDTDPKDYANLAKAYFDDQIWSDFEEGASGLPRAIDLSGNFPAPGNQGTQNSCVGWAVSYLKSYQERIEERWEFSRSTQFSPAWIYNQISGGQDEGSHPLHAMWLMQSKGAATLATMPYDQRDHLTQPSTDAVEEARAFLGGRIKSIDTVQTYRAALAHRVPFVLAMPVYTSFHRLAGTKAVYNDLSGERAGGHAVVVVGYDDDRFGGAFKVLNSWGSSWGNRGFFWLPYDTFRDPKFNAYAITIEDLTNGDTRRPTTEPQRSCGPTGEQLPNLTISSWSAQYDPQQGGRGKLRWRVVNNGPAAAPANVDVILMLSADRTINSADHRVVYEEIPFELKPGGAAHRDADNELTFSFPQTIPTGNYYMALWVDDIDEVRECDEGDNISAGASRVDLQSGKPDLAPTSWHVQWDNAGNGKLEYDIENIGTVATTRTDWRLSLSLHTESAIEYGDRHTLFAERGQFLLNPGASIVRDADNAASFNLFESVSDEKVPLGTYHMTLWVDEFDVIDESNELNNLSAANDLVSIRYGRASPKLLNADHRKYAPKIQRSAIPKPTAPEVDPVWGRERFNGRRSPEALTRRVQIVDNPDGTRRVRFLEERQVRFFDERRGKLPIRSSEPSSVMGPQRKRLARQKVRDPSNPARHQPIFAKRNLSADIVTAPIRESRPMPQ